LPYGKRTGVEPVDRLSIVAHDRFQEIIDEANNPDNPLRLKELILDAPEDDTPMTSIDVGSNLDAMIKGGYPEILKIETPRGRSLWFNAYISTYVERDIRDVGELRDISSFIRFYNIIAPRSCGLVNKSLPLPHGPRLLAADAADDSPVIDIVISNVVCTFNLRCHINLKRLAMEGANVEYRREHGVSGIGTVLIKLNNPAGRPVFQAVLHTPSIAFWCPSSKLCGNRLCH